MDMQIAHSPKRYRYCEYLADDGQPSVMLSQATGCHDKTGAEIYEFDVLAVPYAWLDGILLIPVLWHANCARFDLDEALAVLLDAPRPETLQIEALPLMARWGYVVGTVFEPHPVIEARTRRLFMMSAA
ncbi:MAG: hypothetical protein ACAI44_01010 [Candidatus Sericytochromatia bacterium]